MIKDPTLNKKSIQIKRALLSVFDKEGIIELAQVLVTKNIEILSTGGTAKALRKNKIPVVDVSEYTNFPEIMDGRVKTINPLIEGGILGLRDQHVPDAQKTKLNGLILSFATYIHF